MSALEWLLPVYASVGLLSVMMGALFFVIDPPLEIEDLGAEGRCILGVIAGVLWPLVALVSLFVVLRAIARGVAQVVRFVRPRRSSIPRAEVRRP